MSDNAPEGSASKKNGKFTAVCSSDTMIGDGAKDVITHAVATSCEKPPTQETAVAKYNARKPAERVTGVHTERLEVTVAAVIAPSCLLLTSQMQIFIA
jgi:hypothetical protein